MVTMKQTTLVQSVSYQGIGLHAALEVQIGRAHV